MPARGKRQLKAMRFDTGPAGDHYPQQVLATVVSSGPKVANPIPLPTVFPSPPDLRLAQVTQQREITFADADDSKNPNEQFTINGQFYDHNRIDTTVTLGNTERWTLKNTSKELHVFHIHQTDFQVVSINGVAQPFTGYQDTVSLPFATKKKGELVPGEVQVIIPFTNPVIVGKFVYHCHIVQHADQGMMANIEVVAPSPLPPAGPSSAPRITEASGSVRRGGGRGGVARAQRLRGTRAIDPRRPPHGRSAIRAWRRPRAHRPVTRAAARFASQVGNGAHRVAEIGAATSPPAVRRATKR